MDVLMHHDPVNTSMFDAEAYRLQPRSTGTVAPNRTTNPPTASMMEDLYLSESGHYT
jgi:hypothetical protein